MIQVRHIVRSPGSAQSSVYDLDCPASEPMTMLRSMSRYTAKETFGASSPNRV